MICDIRSCENEKKLLLQCKTKKNTFLFLRFILTIAHIKITMKITVQSSNSNPVATDDTNITTILAGVIVDTGESTDDPYNCHQREHYKHDNTKCLYIPCERINVLTN